MSEFRKTVVKGGDLNWDVGSLRDGLAFGCCTI